MGNSKDAVAKLRKEIADQDRTYRWTARTAGIPYKRILAEIKHETRPVTLDTAIATATALGIAVPDLLTTRPLALAADEGKVPA